MSDELDPMVLCERTACVRYLRALTDQCLERFSAAEVNSDLRARLMISVEALRSAANAIEGGAEEPFFGEGE